MARNPHASYEASDHQRMPIIPTVRFDLLTITMDCTTVMYSQMSGLYSGQYALSDAQMNGATYLVPLYARKSGYPSGPSIAVEGNTVRLTNAVSIDGVSCGILRIYT